MVLLVEGMSCQKNCGDTVQNALRAVAGVDAASVVFSEKRAVVNGTASADALLDAVEAVGFEGALKSRSGGLATNGAQEMNDLGAAGDVVLIMSVVVLDVSGMMCQKNCGDTVQNALRQVPGVTSASVAFDTKRGVVYGTASVATLLDAVESVGFEALEVTAHAEDNA